MSEAKKHHYESHNRAFESRKQVQAQLALFNTGLMDDIIFSKDTGLVESFNGGASEETTKSIIEICHP